MLSRRSPTGKQNVFQIARTDHRGVTDFNIIIKALKYKKKLNSKKMAAIVEGCSACEEVGASARSSVRHDMATSSAGTKSIWAKGKTW